MRRNSNLIALLGAVLALCLLAGCSSAETTSAPAQNEADEPIELADTNGSKQAEAAPEPEPAPAPEQKQESAPAPSASAISYRDVPAFEGNPYVYVNEGEPTFTDAQRSAAAGTEEYGELDDLGRCTTTFAVVGPETQPTEERGSIGDVKPSGWQMAKYDFVEGKYLFNRCHLLGYQLTGENANVRNLITGTRYLNIQGMLPFENAVADYVDATNNHVLMAVVPIFEGDELVARGVQMMAESVEDGGEGVSFNVFCYNVQPGVVINYATGENMAEEDATPLPDVSGADESAQEDKSSADSSTPAGEEKGVADYVLNTNSKKFHVPSCSSVKQMKDKNREDVKDTRENILNKGYDPCKRCNP